MFYVEIPGENLAVSALGRHPQRVSTFYGFATHNYQTSRLVALPKLLGHETAASSRTSTCSPHKVGLTSLRVPTRPKPITSQKPSSQVRDIGFLFSGTVSLR